MMDVCFVLPFLLELFLSYLLLLPPIVIYMTKIDPIVQKRLDYWIKCLVKLNGGQGVPNHVRVSLGKSWSSSELLQNIFVKTNQTEPIQLSSIINNIYFN